MTDFAELMRILSVPRPNGSHSLETTRQSLLTWISQRSIPHRQHAFRVYPYFMICIGIWLILSRTLLALGIWMHWGWATFIIALIGLAGGLFDLLFGIHLVTWPGAATGYNLLMEFGPPNAEQELLISAHYDSKTELLDHQQRMFFLRALPAGIVMTVLLGLLGPLEAALHQSGEWWSTALYIGAVLLSLALLFLAWGLGLNLAFGWLRHPSRGAVDNGAACAILLGLAEKLAQAEIPLSRTQVTLALFTGEEISMQGSRAYMRERSWPRPAAAINLEVMAQDGDYVYWELEGNALKLVPTNATLNAAAAQAILEITGTPPVPGGPVNSDGGSFLLSGIPATTIGTYDRKWKDRGFHSSADNLERVVMARLPEGVKILERLIERYNQTSIY